MENSKQVPGNAGIIWPEFQKIPFYHMLEYSWKSHETDFEPVRYKKVLFWVTAPFSQSHGHSEMGHSKQDAGDQKCVHLRAGVDYFELR